MSATEPRRRAYGAGCTAQKLYALILWAGRIVRAGVNIKAGAQRGIERVVDNQVVADNVGTCDNRIVQQAIRTSIAIEGVIGSRPIVAEIHANAGVAKNGIGDNIDTRASCDDDTFCVVRNGVYIDNGAGTAIEQDSVRIGARCESATDSDIIS